VAEKKHQHLVPRVYLKAFCDPKPPPDHPTGRPFEPALWLLPKSLDEPPMRRAPANVLWESHAYTLRSDDPTQPVVEEALAKLESDYASVLRKLLIRSRLTDREWINLLVFVGTLRSRPSAQMTSLQQQLDKIQAMYRMVDRGANRNEAYSDVVWASSDEAGKRGAIELAGPFARQITGAQPRLLVNNSQHQFITADNPVVYQEVHVDELETFEFPPEMLRPGALRNERTFLCHCALTPSLALVASPLLVAAQPSRYDDVPSTSKLAFWMNLLVRDEADKVIVASGPYPFGPVQPLLPLLSARLTARDQADSRSKITFYTEADRYCIRATTVKPSQGSSPISGRLRLQTEDLEQLRSIAAAEHLVEVRYAGGGQSGGMRNAWFTRVAITEEGDSLIENNG
jgi:hypothetical protein